MTHAHTPSRESCPGKPFVKIASGAVAIWGIGMIWYGDLMFGNRWMELTGITPEAVAEAMKTRAGQIMGLSVLNSVLASLALHMLFALACATTFRRRVSLAAAAALLVGTVIFSGVIWEGKPAELFLIGAGYYAAAFCSVAGMSSLLGASRTGFRVAAATAKGREKEVWILKHVAKEGAGTIHDFLIERGIPVRFIELYRGEAVPNDLTNVRAVCVMGGPMNVDEEPKHPFLKAEKVLIRRLIHDEVPTLGICLGSQLIASALGKRVYKASAPEIGWSEIAPTPDAAQDPVFAALPARPIRVLQWHEDTFDLPDGAALLAEGRQVRNQAFRVGRSVYGFQFHIEVTAAMLLDWFENRSECGQILADYRAHQAELKVLTSRIYSAFFGL